MTDRERANHYMHLVRQNIIAADEDMDSGEFVDAECRLKKCFDSLRLALDAIEPMVARQLLAAETNQDQLALGGILDEAYADELKKKPF